MMRRTDKPDRSRLFYLCDSGACGCLVRLDYAHVRDIPESEIENQRAGCSIAAPECDRGVWNWPTKRYFCAACAMEWDRKHQAAPQTAPASVPPAAEPCQECVRLRAELATLQAAADARRAAKRGAMQRYRAGKRPAGG